MPSRWFTIVVVLFWTATMTWLAITKILPPLRVGKPPNYQSILAHAEDSEPVGWTIHANGDLLGWAATRVERGNDGMSAIQGRVFLQHIPLEDFTPGWLRKVVKPLLGAEALELEARSRVDIDPLGRLTGFESRVQLADLPDALRIQGQVDGTLLHLSVSSGAAISYKDDRYLPSGAFVGDELLPQATLPGLRIGQTWTMPVYSPFRPHKNPIEVLQAEVMGFDRIHWNGRMVNCLLVVYRADSGSGLASQGEPRGKLWVRPDGEVLRQQVMFFSLPLKFERLAAEKCARLSGQLGEDWNKDMPIGAGRRSLKELVDSKNP